MNIWQMLQCYTDGGIYATVFQEADAIKRLTLKFLVLHLNFNSFFVFDFTSSQITELCN